MLEASHLHFCISNKAIVKQASFRVEAGELVALLGPNGAGKSTLFKLLSGEAVCKHGEVLYNGKNIQGYKSSQLASIRAVMPQSSQLSFPFTAKEVVEMGLTMARSSSVTQIVEEVMQLTQTFAFRNAQYHHLSGGEKQRVQLARVLTQIWEKQPYTRYLLLDEPTSSMDIAQQQHVLKIVKGLKDRNIGILAILHDLNLAASYADRVILFKNGNLFAQGITAEVMTSQHLGEVFDHPIQVITNKERGSLMIHPVPQLNKKLFNYHTA
ncbi:heme ABC transporter ATP-binding protein [Pleomorphovibrio marinus]|uniref:heme ABC transporter ATP-binding protein n=1 Tax=Pleomorphovibrio marinus TaxID=2164132 RepID=UPI000E0BACCD|nr:heme ABC transporter ATP-binding protein [Pleomorphovibrio marinus]